MPKLRVMLADDSATIRMVLKHILQKDSRLEVVAEATNGEDAVRLFREHRPDWVFCDIIMPRMDGLRVLQTVRREAPDARFVMVTSISDTKIVLKCLAHGAVDFILKPFDPARVMAGVEALLGQPRTGTRHA